MADYYLQCEHCGSFNPVKTEYLLFCGACNRKMKNNFRDWQSLHPDKQFIHFLHECCVTETISNAKKTSIRLTTRVFVFLVFSVLMLLVSPLFVISGYEKLGPLLSEFYKNPACLIDVKTTASQLSLSGLSFRSPVALSKTSGSNNYPESPVEKYESLTGDFADVFFIMINEVKYKDGLQPEMNLAALSAMEEMKSREGVENLAYHQIHAKIAGQDAVYMEGTYQSQGARLGFVHVFVQKGKVMVQLMVIYDTEFKTGSLQLINKMLESLE